MFNVHIHNFVHKLHSGDIHRGDFAFGVHFLCVLFGSKWVLYIKVHFRVFEEEEPFILGGGDIFGVDIAGVGEHTVFTLQKVREQ